MFKNLAKYISTECGFKRRFSLYCPGCGGSRALEELLKFNIVKSLRFNPVVLLLIITAILFAVTYILEKNKQSNKNYPLIRRVYTIFFLIVWLIFFIVRNILFVCFDMDMIGDFV